jgi:hypothetical protein
MGRASALYTFILEHFWTRVGLKVLFINSSIWENFAVVSVLGFKSGNTKLERRILLALFQNVPERIPLSKKTTKFLNGVNKCPVQNVYSQIPELCGH